MDSDRRTELKRHYKEMKYTSGVYRITNTVNGKIYIGSSLDVDARINRHKAEFTFIGSGTLEVAEIIADVKQYGKENFVFDVVDTLEGEYTSDAARLDDLKVLERMWLDKCQPYDGRGYNKRQVNR